MSILNPKNAVEIYYDLKSAPQAALRIQLCHQYIPIFLFHNCLRALPLALLRRLMTIPTAFFGLRNLMFFSKYNNMVLSCSHK